MKKFDAIGKNPFLKGFFLLLPYITGFALIICAVTIVFQTVVVPSPLFDLITHPMQEEIGGNQSLPESEEGEFPVIPYETQWATLNVEGWEYKDIPVYFGDNNQLLRKGAGMWANSRFCGLPGKTVLSGHVTKHFYEIEDTEIGDLVTMDTTYGKYVYEVTDVTVFNYQDNSLILPDGNPEDRLILYTCYPRKNGHLFKTQRIALICKKIEGKDWPYAYE